MADANLKEIEALTQNLERMREDIIGPLTTASTNTRLIITDSLKQLAKSLEKCDFSKLSLSVVTEPDARELDSITETARARTDRSKFQRVVSGTSDGGTIQQMNRDLDRALAAFQVSHVKCVSRLCSYYGRRSEL